MDVVEELLGGAPLTEENAASAGDAIAELDFEAARALLSELRRRADAGNPVSGNLDSLVGAVQERLTELRVSAAREEASRPVDGEDDGDEPVRRRILSRLTTAAMTPTQLAKQLHVEKESVSRILAALRREELVVFERDPDDGRRRLYHLTDDGARMLARSERSLGPAVPAVIDQSDELAYLTDALANAVRLRRHLNRLDDASTRLRSIARRADRNNFYMLAVEARKELVTTLRQARDWTAHAHALDELGRYATSTDVQDPSTVLPASAHYAYELGRTPLPNGVSVHDREQLLTAAVVDYRTLARTRVSDMSPTLESWALRAAWGEASLAENFREQTELGMAIRLGEGALRAFNELSDSYGMARCNLLLGFCFRLRGQYANAVEPLQSALDLAVENDFRRWRADALVQMGDTLRCLREPEQAISTLQSALGICKSLELAVTGGFAESAIGAAHHDMCDYETAMTHLQRASDLFEVSDHREGRALNTRRLAVVQLKLGRQREAEELARLALQDYYTQPVSPAGTTACLVQLAAAHLDEGGSENRYHKVLTNYVSRPSPQSLIELDPATPQMLLRYAERAEDETLVSVATSIVTTARQRLAEERSQEQALIESLFADAAVQLVDADDGREEDIFSSDNDMAVEPRRDYESLVAA